MISDDMTKIRDDMTKISDDMTKPNVSEFPVEGAPPAPAPSGGDLIPFPNPAAGNTTPNPPAANIPGPPANQGDALFSGDVPLPSTTQPQSSVPGVSPTNNTETNAASVTSQQTVQGQLTELFDNKSMGALWDRARGGAQEFANSRGLANSSMAAQAGEEAVFSQAMPIAQQDANTFAARAQQAQGHLQSMTELAKQGDINSRLQLEQYGYNFQLNEQQNIHNMQLAALQGDIAAGLALQAFGFDTELMKQDYGHRLGLMDVELRNTLVAGDQQQDHRLEEMGVGHQNTLEQIAASSSAATTQDEARFTRDLQQNYLLGVERRTSQYSAEVQDIYQQEGLTPAQQAHAVGVARNNYLSDIDFLQDQYSQSPYWDESWTYNPVGAPPPPTQQPAPPPPTTIPPPGGAGPGAPAPTGPGGRRRGGEGDGVPIR